MNAADERRSGPIARAPRRARRGFTLVELLVVLGIIVVLLSIFIPYAISRRQASNVALCAENLRQIWTGLEQYAKDNGGHMPRVRYDPEKNPLGHVAFTGPDAADPFAADSAVQPNDVTASMWLLLRGGYVKEPGAFVCPGSDGVMDPLVDAEGRSVAAAQRGNFRGPAHLSYSYASPFSNATGYGLHRDLPGDFVLVADINPGIAGPRDNVLAPQPGSPPLELAKANSDNHGKLGQNVLYAYGVVKFVKTPFAGVQGDHIYTAIAKEPLPPGSTPDYSVTGFFGPTVAPATSEDSYLLPADDR